MIRSLFVAFWCCSFLVSLARGEYRDVPGPISPGDTLLGEYFERETKRIEDAAFSGIKTGEHWEEARAGYLDQLRSMLGLSPMPEKTPLLPEITGRHERDDVVVENLVFQSRPGLYVTGNLYRPKMVTEPLPTVLYVCGHGPEKEGGVSFGNKTHYRHHGAWFARNGYVCLVIDTLQLGEIEGIHHGTYRFDRWWWLARGYTPAGVEAWNAIRALDYLETRPEVDRSRIGVTGRSGGGAYSWWVAALDDRVKVAVPVAGITSLRNHVVDGCIEGHCDCMFQVNTFRWDFAMVAALVAPRPLLIVNTDKDTIFPLDGVVEVHKQARQIYRILGAEDKIGLALYEGPHADTQPLRVDAFHWFERFLKGRAVDDEIVDATAPMTFTREELRVFDALPKDERNTRIDESFVPEGAIAFPENGGEWNAMTAKWTQRLRDESFRGWPNGVDELDLKEGASITREGIRFTRYDFTSQAPYRLALWLAHREGLSPDALDSLALRVLDEDGWRGFLSGMGAAFPEAFDGVKVPSLDSSAFEEVRKRLADEAIGVAFIAPRGVGLTAWTDAPTERTHILRRFALLGQTLDGARVWDILRARLALGQVEGVAKVPLRIEGHGIMAGNVLYASLFAEGITRIDLYDLPSSHLRGPTYLNVLRFMDTPQAVAMAVSRTKVMLHAGEAAPWEDVSDLAEKLGWDADRFQVRILDPLKGE
jgi:dienelactone hydrolase